ncbi:cell wall elongation regulator TseB-like domain-containing protein [Bacillus massilinigeriensis]|uniref:cell wall elongation regulator TseB-like domain-containing protein n=1 Tax=Bacillus mediterraneensis TaxID=1805474 RepID=UPI0008F94DC3|nr:DUF5590 domain-containing protein [Bacillus mediterraneensis]
MKKWIGISIVVVVILTGICTKIYLNSVSPVKKGEERAVTILKEKTDLTDFSDFQLFNGEETYYVLKAKNQKDEKVYAWVSEKSEKVITRKVKDGTSRQEAIDLVYSEKQPEEIISVRLGMARIQKTDRPSWEVYYKSEGNSINYYYVDYDTGKKIRAIDNF